MTPSTNEGCCGEEGVANWAIRCLEIDPGSSINHWVVGFIIIFVGLIDYFVFTKVPKSGSGARAQKKPLQSSFGLKWRMTCDTNRFEWLIAFCFLGLVTTKIRRGIVRPSYGFGDTGSGSGDRGQPALEGVGIPPARAQQCLQQLVDAPSPAAYRDPAPQGALHHSGMLPRSSKRVILLSNPRWHPLPQNPRGRCSGTLRWLRQVEGDR